MREFIFLFIQLNLSLLIAYLIWRLLLSKTNGPSFQRYYLLLSAILISIATFVNLSLGLGNSAASLLQESISEISISNESSQVIDNIEILLPYQSLYIIIGSFIFLNLLYSVLRVLYLSIENENSGAYISLSNSTEAFSFFHLIFIGEKIPDHEKEIILRHERIHIVKYHSIDILILRMMECMLWAFPAIYLFRPAVLQVHEYEADEKSCLDEKNYIELLLGQTLKAPSFSLVNSFNSNQLKNRIMRIKNKPQYQHRYSGALIASFLLVLILGINQSLHSSNKVESRTQKAIGEGEVAEFPGGQKAFMEYLGKNIQYPKNVKESGTVYIKFIVDENGKCSNFQEVKGFNDDCSTAAIEALKKMPNWKPATKDGKKVSSELTVPIKFDYSSKK